MQAVLFRRAWFAASSICSVFQGRSSTSPAKPATTPVHTACQVWGAKAKLTGLQARVLHDTASAQASHSPNHSKHTSQITFKVGFLGVRTRARPCLQTEEHMPACPHAAETDRMRQLEGWGGRGVGRGGGEGRGKRTTCRRLGSAALQGFSEGQGHSKRQCVQIRQRPALQLNRPQSVGHTSSFEITQFGHEQC